MDGKVMDYPMVLNLLLSKTRPDGIYIDPETKEKFDMNDPDERSEIVTAEMIRMRTQKKQNP